MYGGFIKSHRRGVEEAKEEKVENSFIYKNPRIYSSNFRELSTQGRKVVRFSLSVKQLR